jgi:hypothetical protein
VSQPNRLYFGACDLEFFLHPLTQQTLSPNPSSGAGYCGEWTNWEKNLAFQEKYCKTGKKNISIRM